MAKPAPKIIPVRVPVDDLRRSAAEMDRKQAKMLVKAYWRSQRTRIATKWSFRNTDHPLLAFFAKNFSRIEHQIKRSFEIYIDQFIESRWASAHPGIGPVIAAGLQAYIDIDKCGDNVGKLWRYAGLDPTSRWLTNAEINNWLDIVRMRYGEQVGEGHVNKICEVFHFNKEVFTGRAVRWGGGRITWKSLRSAMAVIPWNPRLKEICWHLGKGIKYNCNNPDYLYGQLYNMRREWEHKQNADFAYEDQALKIYRTRFKYSDPEPDTIGYMYKNGMLPGLHIDSRARRWATKIFLCHYHQVLYYSKYKKLPKKPHILTAMPEAGEIECPNWPFSTS